MHMQIKFPHRNGVCDWAPRVEGSQPVSTLTNPITNPITNARRLGLAPIPGADPHVAPGWLTAAVALAAVAATMGRRDDEALLR